MNEIGLIGKKIGMTREFYKTGQSVPVTVLKIEKGRVLLIQNCRNDWCKIKTDKFKGWIKVENSWGLN